MATQLSLNEIWEVIPGISKYEASTEERIRNKITKRIRTPCPTRKGYLQVRLKCDDGKTRTKLVHRLILLTFQGFSTLETNHKFGVKSDNRLRKIEYSTTVENARHAEKMGLRSHLRGSDHQDAILNEGDIPGIRQLLHQEVSPTRIAKEYGVHPSTIHNIRRRSSWKHVP